MKLYAANFIKDRSDAYALLARAAEECWGFTSLPEIARTPEGKPFFSEFPDFHFNLSHSQPYALCALGDTPVGADIQIVKSTWRDGLPRRVCSPAELDWLEKQADRWATFALLWSMKEAKVKFTGTGLCTEIRSISVPLPEPGQTLYALDGILFRIFSGDGWQGAVCAQEPPPEEIIWF